MDVVLGLSMTDTAGRVVLVEGERADGVTIESEAFDTVAPEGVPKPSPSEQVSNAILATQQNALSVGHHVVVSGATWDDEAQQAALRDSMIARGLDNVVLMSEQSAAGALARTIGCALGYGTTAVLLVKSESATLSIVDSADGSIAEGPTSYFSGSKLTDLLPEIFKNLETNIPRPRGVVVVGCCAEISAVKSKLESLVALPIIVPEEPDLGLARGAALVAADAVGLEAATVGLAYSQDPDDDEMGLSAANTAVSPPIRLVPGDETDSVLTRIGHAPHLPRGLMAGAICVTGVVTLFMSLAVGIGTTTGDSQRMRAAENAAAYSLLAPARPPAQGAIVEGPAPIAQAQVVAPPAPTSVVAAPPPPPVATPPELPVVAPPEPAVAAPVTAPTPQRSSAPPVVQQPSHVVTEPAPAAAESPITAAPIVNAAPPAEAPPMPAAAPPPVALPPPPPPQAPPIAFPPVILRIGPFRIPLGGSQPAAPPPQQLPPAPPPPQQAPPPYWSPSPPYYSQPSPYAPRGRGRWWPWG